MRAPKASSALVRTRMQRVRQRDTLCETALRSEIHKLGGRYRVDWPIPGTRRRADLSFVSARLVVFVDGCFWHGCPTHGTWPRSNAAWWRKKIEDNSRRDRDTDKRLKRLGWRVLRFWSHENPVRCAPRILRLVRARQDAERLGAVRPPRRKGVVRSSKS
jgi:DNA mismatch endonuclease, patch repair protein